jgi:hypothetical protein
MKKTSIYLVFLLILSFTHSLTITAQSGTVSTDGVYVARMTTAQRTAITTPTNGQMIYNTDDNCFNVYQKGVWQKLCGFDVTLSDIWVQKANFGGAARYRAVGFSIGSKGYMGTGFTGFDVSSVKNDFWEYDPTGNSWTQKANFGGGVRANAVGFSIGSKGYIGTGSNSGFKNDFWEYDPTSNTWTQKANFGGTARILAVGFSIGSKGYIGTGNKDDFWEYDPIGNTWTQKANFGGTARYEAVGFSIGSKGYIGTGTDGEAKNDFWEYDPIGNTWTQKANFGGKARDGAIGFSIGSKGYIGSGYGDGMKNDFWEYDPTANKWTQKANFGSIACYAAVGFSIDSKGYIGTGYEGEFKNDFWEYDPASPINITQQGNVFNGANQLVKTDGTGLIPNAILPPPILPNNVTTQGNVFNGANQLVKLDASGKIINEAFIAPTLLNGWVNYGTVDIPPNVYGEAGYYKDKENRVQLKGLIRSGTFSPGTVLFNLPAGYRPLEIKIYLAVNGVASGSGGVNVYPNGDVRIMSGGNNYVSLDGITFRADQ